MNLFIRMFWLIMQARRQSIQSLTVKNTLTFRVWLHDLGWRDHLPNYRVYSFMELGRFAVWSRSRLTQSECYGFRMIAAQDFIYLRPIAPLQKFTMTTQLLAFDEKYFYFRHDFLVAGKLVGIGLVKEASVKKGKVVVPATLLASSAQPQTLTAQSANNHPVVSQWLATQQAIKNFKE